MDNATIMVISVLVALVVGLMLVILYKRKVIDAELIEGIGNLMDSIKPHVEGSPFWQLMQFARTAVNAVEQMVKTGVVNKDDKSRKEKAMEIVQAAAISAGIDYGDAEREVASACIEAEVHDLPRNYIARQEPPETKDEE